MPLPEPIGRQREVLYLPAVGHTVVLGTAGSGKTTLAILRSALLAKMDPGSRVLLVTFNKMLVTYLRSIAAPELANVEVRNYHHFARGYLDYRGKMGWNKIADGDARERLIGQALDEAVAEHGPLKVFDRPASAFAEEIAWIAKSGILNLSDYIEAERVGRSALRITRKDRPMVWELYERYQHIRRDAQYWYDWDDVAIAVHHEMQSDTSARYYKHVVIDEGQDFSPAMLRSLAAAIPDDGTLTFFGDVAQQIYGTRVSWRSAGLHPPKEWKFEENYRNTKQIAQLAVAIAGMPYYVGTPDLVVPNKPKADGPLPTIVTCATDSAETDFVISQAKSLCRTQSVAILLRRRDREDRFLNALARSGVPLQRLHRDANKWFSGPSISVGTFAAAKGLEFDTVLIPYCNDDMMPDPERLDVFDDPEDGLGEEGRLLYVAVTRARSGLIFVHSRELTQLLPDDPSLYTFHSEV